ncbi:HNH endonuclease [Tsukamurella pseudospumae]|uniref:HNH nuclease domain-containing protein n=1 Tax=Tsukamurella pseudospumae TaxID=239498 RepID=A0A137ZRT3_9ACTN|nr:HNH endonuclease [Tsukamurella pseudospumae]KXP00875.1 hypothetical protein AXK61_12765 [Tsukamurella pseudospumae]
MTEPESFREILEPLVDLMDTRRAEVIRTSQTEERAPISDAARLTVLRRCHYRCEWCGSRTRLELDHIVPWSAGGSDNPSNLRALCHTCNQDRSNWVNDADMVIAHRNATMPSGMCLQHYSGDPDTFQQVAHHRERVFCLQCGSVVLGITFDSMVNEIDDLNPW